MGAVLIILNWIVLVALLAYGAYFASTTSGFAEGIGGFIGAGGIWSLAPTFTLLASRRPAGKGIRWAAYIANTAVIALFAVFGVGEYGGAEFGYFLMGVVICCTPFALNLWSLWKFAHPKPVDLEFVEEAPLSPANHGAVSEVYAATVPNAAMPPAPVVRTAASTSAPTPIKVPNYLVRHWRGDLSLPVAYWINGSLIGVLMVMVAALLTELLEAVSLQKASIGAILLYLLIIVVTVWSLVGIWRSTLQHPSRGGSRGWATTAQVMLIIGGLSFAGTFTSNILPQLKVLTLIATGNDPMGRIEATFSTDGRTLILKGAFGEGSTDVVRNLLEAAPGVQAVMLESLGGRLQEAEDVAALVAAYELDTYVEANCESACTFVFLAGIDRAATPNARIGFHRPWFPGMDAIGEAQMLADMQSRYRSVGISQPFLAQIAATPAEDMWYPTEAELISNGVITRLSTGGEVASTALNLVWGADDDDIVRALRETPLFTAYARHFPSILHQAAAAAGRVQVAGGTDAEVMTAARSVISDHADVLLLAANTEQLRTFVALSIDQLSAARSISDEACGLLIAGALDITKVFPPQLLQRELDWTLSVLAGSLTPQSPVSEVQATAAIEPLLAALDPQYIMVAADLEAYADDPGLQCDASIHFYDAVMALSERNQSITLRAMFQSE